jgi:hypothetical protein
MSWGAIFGVGWGGGGLAEGFYVTNAYAVSSQSFIVAFSNPPNYTSPIGATDASNLTNIALGNNDTGLPVRLLTSRLVRNEPLLVEYILTAPFRSSLTGYTVTAANLVSTTAELLIEPKSATFSGMPSVQLPVQEQRPLIDLYNPQTSGELLNGGLVITTGGDHAFESGVSLMRKLIMRRITTAQAEFYHLADVDYGLGIQPKLTPTPSDLVGFRTTLQAEIAKEPEIGASSVSLTLTPDHVLTINISAKLKSSGQQIAFIIPLPSVSL